MNYNQLAELTVIPVWPSMILLTIQIICYILLFIGMGVNLGKGEKEKALGNLITFVIGLFTLFLLYKGGLYIPLFGPYFH